MRDAATIRAIATAARATSAAGAAAGRTRASGNARSHETCSWTASACRAAPNGSPFGSATVTTTLRGSESRTLASVGAFRVIPAHDLRDTFDKPLDPRHGELWHLRDSGLAETVRLDRDTSVVTLTKEGRDLLEDSRRDADSPDRQTFNHGVQRPRELKHDAEVYRAYLQEAERLHEVDANIHRVVLENELKAEYQAFLQERNRDRDDSDGRPDRDPSEIQSWAREHNLPCDDQGHVQFPDVRIEYDIDGRDHTLDVEVMTPHYRGAHAAAKSGSGFTLYFSGRSGGGGRSGGRSRSAAEEWLR